MLILRSRPSDCAVTVSGSTGAALVGDGSQLFNGRPDSMARVTWPSGTQTLATVLRIQIIWASAIVPGGWFLQNTTLPAGTLIQVKLKRPADAGFTYAPTQGASDNIFAKPRGERVAGGIFETGLDPIIGMELAIFNNVNGSPTIVASSAQDIGEIYPGIATSIVINNDWLPNYVDPTTEDRTDGASQPYYESDSPYRQLTFTPMLDSQTAIFGDPSNPNAIDMEELFATLDRGQQGVFIPRWQNPDGTYSAWLIHRLALFGTLIKPAGWQHLFGTTYQSNQLVASEAPTPT